MDTRRRPSRVWYWVGAGVVVLGLAAAVGWGVSAALGFVDRIDNLQRVEVPGTGTVRFSKPGGYTLYYEAPGASGGPVPSVQLSLVSEETGEEVAFTSYDGDLTYDVAGHEGRAVVTFRIDQPGAYRLEAFTDEPVGAQVALGGSLTHGIAGAVVGAVLVAFLGLCIGALVITLTAVKRHR